MKIKEMVERAHATAKEKGWYESGEVNIGEKLALIHSEISEALEAYRDDPEGMADFEAPQVIGKPEGFAIELADAVIRIADLCGHLGIDLTAAIAIKMNYNDTRPHRHGGKAC